jgi:triacylglycerol esterase/lipase EstA (alpha/beta hydrolase family)
MPSRSILARLQQLTTIVLLGLSLAWLAWQWPRSPAAATAGAVAIFFSYSFFLAVEFALVKIVGRSDPSPAPRGIELLRAWWAETWMALAVFCWRQPFRWRVQPDCLDAGDARRRGVVLVHGFLCNRGFWNPWMTRLRANSHPFIAVNLEPVFASIDDYAAVIDAAVKRLAQATGMPPLIVGHSMGGLAVRAWMRANEGSAPAVHGVITIGTPHRGTWLGRFSHTRNGRQMRLGGEWTGKLRHDPASARLVCWYSNCDNVVFPASAATLPGADNRLVRGAAHIELAFEPRVFAHVLEQLRDER